MTLFGSNIHDESKRSMNFLMSLDSETYNPEVSFSVLTYQNIFTTVGLKHCNKLRVKCFRANSRRDKL